MNTDNEFALNEFALTEEHLKLLRHMCVGWQDCEFGAPEINPKRPYGNSDVEFDMCEILGIEFDDEAGLDPALMDRLSKLHGETQTALQIMLQCGAIELGIYRKPEWCKPEWYGVAWERAEA